MDEGMTNADNPSQDSDALPIKAALPWLTGSGAERARRRALTHMISHSTFPIVRLPPNNDTSAEHKDDTALSQVKVIGTAFSVFEPGVFATALHVLDAWKTTPKNGPPKWAWQADKDEPSIMIPVESRQDGGELRINMLVVRIPLLRPSPIHDLALLFTMLPSDLGRRLDPIPLSEEPCMEGDSVIAAGYPFGVSIRSEGVHQYYFGTSFSRGIVSKVLPVAGAPPLEQSGLYLDTTINKNSSGGPLIDDTTGQAVGVITDPVTVPEFGNVELPTGLGGAVPIIHLRALLAEAHQDPAIGQVVRYGTDAADAPDDSQDPPDAMEGRDGAIE